MLNTVQAESREKFKHVVLANAYGIIMVHNHTSGRCVPSDDEIRMTKRITETGELLGVLLQDHIIKIGDGHFSFMEEGLLKHVQIMWVKCGADFIRRYGMKKEEVGFVIHKINQYIPKEDQKLVDKSIREIIERAQDEGFMEGYEYAIGLLQESMVKKSLW